MRFLVTEEEGYTILRERTATGELKTSVVVPLEDFINNKKEINYGKEEC